jgi:hypothetical protein
VYHGAVHLPIALAAARWWANEAMQREMHLMALCHLACFLLTCMSVALLKDAQSLNPPACASAYNPARPPACDA